MSRIFCFVFFVFTASLIQMSHWKDRNVGYRTALITCWPSLTQNMQQKLESCWPLGNNFINSSQVSHETIFWSQLMFIYLFFYSCQIFREIPEDWKPYWSEILIGFRTMTDLELKHFPEHKFGQVFTTLKSECPTYLPWLEQRLVHVDLFIYY